MGKTSSASADTIKDFGVAEDRTSVIDDYAVSFVSIHESHDLAQAFKGLPGGHCSCPHWGYVFKGRVTVRYDDHEEVFEAGDAYYMPPGHVPAAEAGSEFLQFSPAAEMAATEAAVAASMQAG